MGKPTKRGGGTATRQKKKAADKAKGTVSKAPASKVTTVSGNKGRKTGDNKKKRKTSPPGDNEIGIQERSVKRKETLVTDLERAAGSSSEENDDEDSNDQDSNAGTESEMDDDNSSTSVDVSDTIVGVDSNTSKTSGERRDSKVKVEESVVVRDNKGIDKYVKKNNKLDEDDMIEKKHYRKTINYLLNKKVTAERELVKLTTVHSVDIKAKAMKQLNERMVEYVNQVLARNSLRYEIMYPTAAVNILSCLCF
jgi:hypothetical protein